MPQCAQHAPDRTARQTLLKAVSRLPGNASGVDACPFCAFEAGFEAGCAKALGNGELAGGDTAVGAYWAFFEAFNSRNSQRFSSALNYPHVRVAPRQTPALTPNLTAHAASVSWDELLATGWARTTGHDPEVLHLAADRAHIVGGWTRKDGRGRSILVNRVTYVVTRTEHGWGVQSRFGTDAGDAEGSGETDQHHQRAVELVEEYIDAYNDRHWARCTRVIATPHYQVDVGMVRKWEGREDVWAALRDGSWHFVTPRSTHAVQGAENSVTVAFEGVLDGGDHTVKGVFFVVRQDDEWGIRARSIIVE